MSSIAVFLILGGGAAFAALGKNTVGTRQLKPNSVNRAILARNSVYPGKINLEAVKAGRIAKNAIARDRLRNGIVSTDKIADLGVTGGKLANNAVTNPKLANNAVTNPKLASNAVGTDKIANNAVNSDKVDSSIQKSADLLFATVAPANAAAAIVRGRGAVSVIRQKAGSYRVTFNRDITGCTWLATYGQPNDSFVDALWATVRGRDDPTQVGVVLRNAAGAEVDGVGFHVAAFCP